MKVFSKKDEIELTDSSVVIRKRGVANALASGMNGDRTIAISTITAIQVKLGSFFSPGYILFSYAGSKPFRGGLIAATQDPDAFVFSSAENDMITEFKKIVEEKLRKLASSSENAVSDELKKLHDLFKTGVLTEDEFRRAKKNLLGISI